MFGGCLSMSIFDAMNNTQKNSTMTTMTKSELLQEANYLEQTLNKAVEFGDLYLVDTVSYRLHKIILELDSRGEN